MNQRIRPQQAIDQRGIGAQHGAQPVRHGENLDPVGARTRAVGKKGHVAMGAVFGQIGGAEAAKMRCQIAGQRLELGQGGLRGFGQPDVVARLGAGGEQDRLGGGVVQQTFAGGIEHPHHQIRRGLAPTPETGGGIADGIVAVPARHRLAQKPFGAQVAVMGAHHDTAGRAPVRPGDPAMHAATARRVAAIRGQKGQQAQPLGRVARLPQEGRIKTQRHALTGDTQIQHLALLSDQLGRSRGKDKGEAAAAIHRPRGQGPGDLARGIPGLDDGARETSDSRYGHQKARQQERHDP